MHDILSRCGIKEGVAETITVEQMLAMKQTILILTVILFGASIVFAQKLANHRLVVTGSVLGVEKKCVNGKPFAQLGLYMQFRNDGEGSLLLIRPSYFVTTKVSFVADRLGDPTERRVPAGIVAYNPYLENPFDIATNDDYDPFPSFVRRLDTPLPPLDDLMVKIDPGGYYEFHNMVWVKTGFRIDMKSGTTQEECLQNNKAKPVPEYPSFYLEYYLSLQKYDRGTELLKTLQNRWKRFGHLPLDSNGDVSIKSERIRFDIGK